MISCIAATAFFISAIVLTVKRRPFKHIILCFISAALLLSIGVLNTTLHTESISLSTDTLDAITQIDWSNEEALIKIGFQGERGAYTYCLNDEERPYNYITSISTHTTYVTDIENAKDTYNNIRYDFTEKTRVSKLEYIWRRIIKKDIPVRREYFLYFEGRWLMTSEIAIKGQPYLFEKLIAEIKEKYDSLSAAE